MLGCSISRFSRGSTSGAESSSFSDEEQTQFSLVSSHTSSSRTVSNARQFLFHDTDIFESCVKQLGLFLTWEVYNDPSSLLKLHQLLKSVVFSLDVLVSTPKQVRQQLSNHLCGSIAHTQNVNQTSSGMGALCAQVTPNKSTGMSESLRSENRKIMYVGLMSEDLRFMSHTYSKKCKWIFVFFSIYFQLNQPDQVHLSRTFGVNYIITLWRWSKPGDINLEICNHNLPFSKWQTAPSWGRPTEDTKDPSSMDTESHCINKRSHHCPPRNLISPTYYVAGTCEF